MTKEKNKEKAKKELQEKYIELQLLNQHAQEIQKQIQAVEMQLTKLISAKEAVSELENTKIGSELYVQLAPGIFVKGELKENKEVQVSVGGNVVVPKSISEAKELIDRQIKELENFQEQLNAELQITAQKAVEVEKAMEALSKNV